MIQTILIILAAVFIPSLLTALTLPLWWWKKVHNELILWIGTILMLIPFIWVWNSINNWILALLAVIALAIPNVYGWRFFRNRLKKNRCPECHEMNVRVIDHEADTKVTTTRTKWSDGSVTYSDSSSTTHYYTVQCPDCGHTYEWCSGDDEN